MHKLSFLLTLVLCLAFTGCGGGGGGGGGGSTTTVVGDSADLGGDDAGGDDSSDGSNGDTGDGGADGSPDDGPGITRDYTLFESGQVRPLAFSPDGSRLFVANTPANRLDIYRVAQDKLELSGSVPVGLEPVAVAARDNSEVWVVNHLSDSVSVVDVGAQPHVRQTLLVGDEPRDIVFAGTDRNLAFITAAYRGQNHPTFDPEDLTTPGLGRADLWVYNADELNKADLNGGSLVILNLFVDSLRSLTALPNGSRVYAGAFMSGNGTTTIDALAVEGGKPEPRSNKDGIPAPKTGLIVKQAGNRWLDEAGTNWAGEVKFKLPDYDVFEIDTTTPVPQLRRQISSVGTTLFNLVVNAERGELYVSNLEARNEVRFEGPGESATTVRGHIADTRISVVNNAGVVRHVDLNQHVNFNRPEGASVPAAEAQKSLSQVTALALTQDGNTLIAAAFGSGKLAFIDVDELSPAGYSASTANQLQLPGGGPSGLALSPDGALLAVYTRFDNAVHLVDPAARRVLSSTALYNPEPDFIVKGRQFLYDAALTSANGVNACSSCHIFGDNDALAWDLGNPDAAMQDNPNEFVANSPKITTRFHPMKGPMTTQTLRGIADSGPQHWRGDRTGENRASGDMGPEPLAAAAFKEFNPAFVGLVGRQDELTEEQMQQFTDFALALTPPPNPVRQIDNSLTTRQQAGRDIYFNVDDITGIGSCNHCHSLDPARKQFGSGGKMSFEGGRIAEDFKVPHLRNAYAKVGMFGSSSTVSDGQFMGPQVRAFGYLHDGAIDTLDHFFQDPVFKFPDPVAANRADVVRFVMVMESNLAPVVGQQVTLSGTQQTLLNRLDLLEERALVITPRPECDLKVSGVIDGVQVALQLASADRYVDGQGGSFTSAQLREAARADGQALTFTCFPPEA